MKLKPLFDRVILKRTDPETVTAGGLILPSNQKERTEVCEVVEVGPGGKYKGEDIEMIVKPGQKVVIREFAGTDFNTSVGEKYKIVMQQDIIAIVED